MMTPSVFCRDYSNLLFDLEPFDLNRKVIFQVVIIFSSNYSTCYYLTSDKWIWETLVKFVCYTQTRAKINKI